MSSQHARILEILARMQEQINDLKPDITSRRVTIQKYYTLSQTWKSLTAALVETGETADRAVMIYKRQCIIHQTHTNRHIRTGGLRNVQANACIGKFRYVLALSHHLRVVQNIHSSQLESWNNMQDHYEDSLRPQADTVRPHQTFLADLDRNVETMMRSQRLEIIYIRWLQIRARADLERQGKEFQILRKRLDVQKKRVEKECKRATYMRKEAVKCIKEYKWLETEVVGVQKTMEALWDSDDGLEETDAAVSVLPPVLADEEGAGQMDEGGGQDYGLRRTVSAPAA